ncbi:MAG TPA: hypothetical protein VMN56_13725 [Casimicrobiaceae bacterium]|nr:hypothetical protein [Casimicrobiaceae bacterium]
MEEKWVGVKNCADDPQHGSPGAPYKTIQYGVDQLASLGGGMLHVQSGRYAGGVRMEGARYSNIEIRGDVPAPTAPPTAPGADDTVAYCESRPVVDAKSQDTVFTIAKATNVWLTNLYIVNGSAPNVPSMGGGVYAHETQVSLDSCCFQGNVANCGGAFAFVDCTSGECVIDSCRVFDNQARPGTAQTSNGGGGFLRRCRSIRIEDCDFRENQAEGTAIGPGRGGALYAEDCKSVYVVGKQTRFLRNSAGEFGGAMFLGRPAPQGQVVILDSLFSAGNKAASGGAVAIVGDPRTPPPGGVSPVEDVYLWNNEIANNNADRYGGGVFIGYSMNVKLSNNRIRLQNEAHDGGGIYITANCDVTLDDGTEVSSNLAKEGYGGGAYAENSRLHAVGDTRFDFNQAKNGAGACFLVRQNPDTEQYLKKSGFTEASLTVNSAHFAMNFASADGGGLYCFVNVPLLLMANAPKLNVEVNGVTTFTSNEAVTGGGFYAHSFDKLAFKTNRLIGNQAKKFGGGGYISGRSFPKELHIQDNVFTNNGTRGHGAGLSLFGCELTLGEISGNTFLQSMGEGIYLETCLSPTDAEISAENNNANVAHQ